jgi:hypothetical protein
LRDLLPMKPLFTIHAGEYLVASHIEENFPRVNVWIPSKDTGVDLLISDSRSKRTVSLQVKFSKDFLFTTMQPIFRDKGSRLRACGWWTINREKLKKSAADFWVLVLFGFNGRTKDFVIVSPGDLLQRLESIHGPQKVFQTYLWVTKAQCWETRGIGRQDLLSIARGQQGEGIRNFSQWLNIWTPIEQLNNPASR